MATPAMPEPIGAPTVNEMLSMIPAGALESASSIPEPTSEGVEPDTPVVEDDTVETHDEPAAGDEPADEPPSVEAAKPEETPKEEAAPAEELPEGVKKGKRNGEEGYFVTPERWKKIYDGAYKTTQEISNLLGEPMTAEAIKGKLEFADSWEGFTSDITSGDRGLQDKTVSYLLDRMAQAHRNGETAVDPSVSFVDTLYSKLAGSGTPAEHAMRLRNTQDLARELFEGAARSGDELLANSVQHVVRYLAGLGPNEKNPQAIKAAADRMGLPFRLIEELPQLAQGNTPEAQLRAENARLRAQLNGGNGAAPAGVEPYTQWAGATKQARDKAMLDEVILPSLAAQKEAWAKANLADQFDLRIIQPLQAELNKVLDSDQSYQDRMSTLREQAKRATSKEVRQRIAQEITTLTKNRANLSVEALKAKHVKFAAEFVKQQADSAHQRRSGAQQRTVPRGASAPVNRGLVPPQEVTYKDGVFDPATAMQDMKSRISALVRS